VTSRWSTRKSVSHFTPPHALDLAPVRHFSPIKDRSAVGFRCPKAHLGSRCLYVSIVAVEFGRHLSACRQYSDDTTHCSTRWAAYLRRNRAQQIGRTWPACVCAQSPDPRRWVASITHDLQAGSNESLTMHAMSSARASLVTTEMRQTVRLPLVACFHGVSAAMSGFLTSPAKSFEIVARPRGRFERGQIRRLGLQS
jgi:hypothetical protein